MENIQEELQTELIQKMDLCKNNIYNIYLQYNLYWEYKDIIKSSPSIIALILRLEILPLVDALYLRKDMQIYRILWCNGHIIAFKNHIRITFTE